MKEFIESTLGSRIQADGGWVEFVSLENDILTLIFRGECSKCDILDRCTEWIGDECRKRYGKRVTVKAIRRKPYFWDK